MAYTLHYYAAAPSQQQPLRDRAIIAINKGICVFITEYGTVFYTGLGAVDVNASEVWWEFNDLHKLSYVNWAIMDNNPNSEPNNTGANALTQNSIVDQMGMPSHWTTSGTLVNQKYHTTNQGVNGKIEDLFIYIIFQEIAHQLGTSLMLTVKIAITLSI